MSTAIVPVVPPVSDDSDLKLNAQLLVKIQNFMNDSSYRESIQNAADYNSRLTVERTQRLPFLDSQTGVAQNHSNLWMDARERLPGVREGQVYTYPSKRWKKKRRQYLSNFMQPRFPTGLTRKEVGQEDTDPPPVSSENSNSTPGPSSVTLNEDSKESFGKDEQAKQQEWYYDELDMQDTAEFEDPDADSDYDYEESYSKRKKKKPVVKPPRGSTSGSRGRRSHRITYDAVTDPEKPFGCDLCGARYKTRPGLTYHYTHSHKEKDEEDNDDGMMGGHASPNRDDGTVYARKQRSFLN